MALPWVRMDTQWATNPKFLMLVEDRAFKAVCVYWAALGWSGAQGQSGYVPIYALPMVHGSKKEATQLVEVGLWDPAPAGWQIHDWADYQPSSEEHKKRSEKARAAAAARWNKQRGEATG